MEILIIILLGIIALAVAPELTLLIFIGIPLLCVAGLVLFALLPSFLAALPTLIMAGAVLAAFIGIPMLAFVRIDAVLHRRWRERIDRTWNAGGREKLMKSLRGLSVEQIQSQLWVSDWPNWRVAVAAELERRKSNEAKSQAAWAQFWARMSARFLRSKTR